MSAFKSWEELSELEKLQSEFYDFYKEVYGFRPRSMDNEQWNSVDWLKAQITSLVLANERKMSEDTIREAAVVETFDKKVLDIMACGKISRGRALKWILDANDAATDPDYACYQLGLPYGYFKDADK